MPFTKEIKEQGEIHTIMFEGTLTDGDLKAFAAEIIAPFRQGCSSVIIVLEKIEEISEAVVSYLYKLNDELQGRGAFVTVVRPQGDISPRPKDGSSKCILVLEQNRHIALGAILEFVTVKQELLKLIQNAKGMTYTVPELPDDRVFEATFLRNLQNFLVIDPGESFDENLRKGVKLRFQFELEEEQKIVSFEAEVYKFAILKGRQVPCLVIRVPELLDVQDQRKDPRLAAELKMQFWGSSGDRTPMPGLVCNISGGGFQFKTRRFKHSPGAELFCDIDFKVFKFSQAPRCRVVRCEHTSQGDLLIACEFIHLMGHDQAVLDDYILNYC